MHSINKTLKDLSSYKDEICVSISMPTHRTFPDNNQDRILLKNLISEAESNLIDRFGKRDTTNTRKSLYKIAEEVNFNYSLDSLHIFVSQDFAEVIRLPISIRNSEVIINDSFSTYYIKEAIDEKLEYLILLMSQGGVHLYDCLNDAILDEVKNDDFPMDENSKYITHSDKRSDSKQVDNLVKEYFNKVDKALQRTVDHLKLPVVVVCTPRNYDHLMAISDNPSVYKGNSPINYNDITLHTLSKQAYKLLVD